MRAGQLACPEIPPMRIADDTRGFGRSGCERKRQDGILGGMLGVVRGTKLLGIWSKPPLMQRLGNTEAMCSRHYNQQASLAREVIKRLAFLRNVAPHEVSGFDLSSW